LTKNIRASYIHEFVQFGKDTEISDVLLTYVEHRDTLTDPNTKNAPLSLRKKWIDQIRDMVRTLHAAGIVWGDAKPDNILIDSNNDLWTIDFGGSYATGWVNEDLMETVQGDLQSLSRIINFLEAKTGG
jgi:tRNA A-37 threonylcarbamoyl transferase component Bud32